MILLCLGHGVLEELKNVNALEKDKHKTLLLLQRF